MGHKLIQSWPCTQTLCRALKTINGGHGVSYSVVACVKRTVEVFIASDDEEVCVCGGGGQGALTYPKMRAIS